MDLFKTNTNTYLYYRSIYFLTKLQKIVNESNSQILIPLI